MLNWGDESARTFSPSSVAKIHKQYKHAHIRKFTKNWKSRNMRSTTVRDYTNNVTFWFRAPTHCPTPTVIELSRIGRIYNLMNTHKDSGGHISVHTSTIGQPSIREAAKSENAQCHMHGNDECGEALISGPFGNTDGEVTKPECSAEF
jgi:hypothetical protein